MRFSPVSLLPLLAAVVRAQGGFASDQNPFSIPSEGFNATAGQKLTLSWSPTTSGTVSLVLRSGQGTDLAKGLGIASGIQNSGSYTWDVPSSVSRGDYTVEIVDDGNPDSNTNYTPFFQIDSDVTASSLASSVTLGAPTTSLSLSTVSPSSVPSNAAGTTGPAAAASGPLTQSGPAGETASTTSAPTSSESHVSTAPGVPSAAAASLSSAVASSSASSSGSLTTSASSSGSGSPTSSGSAGAASSTSSAASSAAAATQQAFGGMVAFAIAGVIAAL